MRIKISNLSRKFGKVEALKNFNLQLEEGSRLALVGPNGSGKSSLAKAIMGFINYEGVIEYGTGKRKLDNGIKNQIAYIPQIPPHFSSSVGDMVSMIRSLRTHSWEDFLSIFSCFNLSFDEIQKRPFSKLSGGMKQKLMIAIALFTRPKLLIMDEPTSSLDPPSRQNFYHLCKQLEPQMTFILCSHRIDEIRHLIKEVIVMEEGEISFKGSAKDYRNQKTSSLIEVLIRNEDPLKKETLRQMNFEVSLSGWWQKTVEQEDKMASIERLQSFLKKDIADLVVVDINKKD